MLRDNPIDLPLLVIYAIKDIHDQDDDNEKTKDANSLQFERCYIHGCHDIHPTFPRLLNIDHNSTEQGTLNTYINRAIESTDITEVSPVDVETLLSGLKDRKWNDRYTQAYLFSLSPSGTDRARAVAFVGMACAERSSA